MTRKIRITFFLIVFPAVTAVSSSAQRVETGFLDRSIKVKGTVFKYVVYVPREFTRTKKWPVIVELHGGGEYGSDGLKQTEVGIGKAIRLHPERFHAIVILPQARDDNTPGWQLKAGDAVLAQIDRTIREFRGDPKRVVLTGYSAGGNGTWSIASRHPNRFAAIVPVCGFVFKFTGLARPVEYPPLAPAAAGDVYDIIAKKVSRLPVWILHGDADKNVPVEESRKMAAALKALGANVRYTELPGVEHNAWDPAYSRADLIEWMLKQRRP